MKKRNTKHKKNGALPKNLSTSPLIISFGSRYIISDSPPMSLRCSKFSSILNLIRLLKRQCKHQDYDFQVALFCLYKA